MGRLLRGGRALRAVGVGAGEHAASATSIAQLEGLIRATQLTLTPADIEALDTASAPDTHG